MRSPRLRSRPSGERARALFLASALAASVGMGGTVGRAWAATARTGGDHDERPAAARRFAAAADKPNAVEKGGAAEKPGAAAPPAEGADAPASRPPASAPDLGKLRAEYDRIREELFKARVRSQKASETAYPSRLDVHMRWKGGPDFVIRKARMLLDGSELWDSGDRPQTDDVIDVSERPVKPGPHAFTVRLEIRPKAEAKGGTKTGADKLGYTSEHSFAIVVAPTGKTHLELTGDEGGDPPEYEPELELELETDQ